MTRWWIRISSWTILVVMCLGVRSASLAQARGVSTTGRTVAQAVGSGTLILHGSLTSVATISMTGAFSVGNAHNLQWSLPRVTSLQENGYSEQFDAVTYTFDIQPDSFSDLEVDGRAIRRFLWTDPPANKVIHVTQTLRATVRSDLSPLHSTAVYPMRGVAPAAASFVQMTPMVQLPSGLRPLLRSLTAGKHTEQAVVAAVVNWVAAHTAYGGDTTDHAATAKAVLVSHRAICRGYDNVTTGILRALGIPVRTEFGWVSSGQFNLPGPNHGTSYIRWAVPGSAGEAHAWLSVYFPDVGWVPIDPQREKFFVDSHHFAFFSAMDAGNPRTGAWSADYYGTESPTGTPLPDGNIEIVPGDGVSSRVTVHAVDAVHATLTAFQHDVHGVLLFSR
jgi:Transglutaminase-like superfamily